MCQILNGHRDRAVWMWRFNPLDLCLWGWIKIEVYKWKVDTRNELLARIVDAAARVKEHENQLRRTTRDPRTRVINFVEFVI